MPKSILEGRKRPEAPYGLCFGDSCSNPASKLTAISGLGPLNITSKGPSTQKKSTKAEDVDKKPYDPRVTRLVPLCKTCDIKSQRKGATSHPLNKEAYEAWKKVDDPENHEARTRKALGVDEIRTSKNALKGTESAWFMGTRKNSFNPLQEVLNYQIRNPKPGTGKSLTAVPEHGRGVPKIDVEKETQSNKIAAESRRTPAEREAILGQALEKHRKGKKGNWKKFNNIMEERRQKLSFDNRRWLEDKAPYDYDQAEDVSTIDETRVSTSAPTGPGKKKRTRRTFSPTVQSGDITLTGKEAAYETSLEPRLKNIEKEYAAKKAARLAGKQFNPTVSIRGGNNS